MAKGYKSNKRAKEISRQKKQEEKRLKRLARKNAPEESDVIETDPLLPSEPGPSIPE